MNTAITAICRRLRPDDRGSISLQMAVIAPVMLALIWITVQAGIWYNARHVALAAAQQGARAASVSGGSVGAGGNAAREFLSTAGNGQFTTRSVSPIRSGNTVTVTVTGTTQSFVPGLHGTVTQSATMPVERFTNRNTR